MRSARMLLATAAASTVLVLGAPGAYAAADEWDNSTDSSYSKEQDKDSGKEKEYDKEATHDSPRGGMHTGGGALTAADEGDLGTAKDTKRDSGGYQEKEQGKESGSTKQEEDSWSGKKDEGSWSGDRAKPSGGMHTGGGALAASTVTAGGLAVLAVVGTGLYAARRKKTAGSVA
ncbi:hypothetical protein [Streptomyces sp. NBC_00878]|uniref:hypothetical protein n=1 Tax=Streptomyces sp. NBC_00878 TaxID=2975854 RepID=UPI002251EDB4|nr:hypothetical protein [Streptomyces sp. NBC_00878]MCX4907425.1 hypothetical protein [Streptomyces sp. NBC_00878]